VQWRPDGSWVYPYFQENRDPAQRDKEATNRGLVKCMSDGVPVGRGQARFRTILFDAYGRKCAISCCDAADALEAAHIAPYLGSHSDHVQNGLLLRADLHSLFDLGLLSVDPTTFTVVIASDLERTTYGDLAGLKLSLPADPQQRPSPDALAKHLDWAGIRTPPERG